jgi:ketosteroid isomerase-like protein
MSTPEIDLPDVVEDVKRQFWAYEKAFMANDVEALIDFFWSDPRLTRYGIADRQQGIEQMRAFRRASPAPDFTRRIEDLRVTTFGDASAVACCEFVRSDTSLRGFQSQTWMRLGDAGWKIVSAHVSMSQLA